MVKFASVLSLAKEGGKFNSTKEKFEDLFLFFSPSFVEVCSTARPIILNLGGIRMRLNARMEKKKEKTQNNPPQLQIFEICTGVTWASLIKLTDVDHKHAMKAPGTHRLQISDALGELTDAEQEIQPLAQLRDFTHLHRIEHSSNQNSHLHQNLHVAFTIY